MLDNENVMHSLRLVEELKLEMLKNATDICEILLNCADEDFFERMTDKTADMLICTYLLANSAGIPYSVTESSLRKKLKLYLLDSKDSDILNKCVASLAEYAFG